MIIIFWQKKNKYEYYELPVLLKDNHCSSSKKMFYFIVKVVTGRERYRIVKQKFKKYRFRLFFYTVCKM
jgi:hypothetical protein